MKTVQLVKTIERAITETQNARIEETDREAREQGLSLGALTPDKITPGSTLALLITAERALRNALTLAQMDLAAEKISARAAERRRRAGL